MTAVAVAAEPVNDWSETGTKVLPERYRDLFLSVLAGERSGFAGDAEPSPVRWKAPNRSHPFSPGYSLNAIVQALELRGVRAVTYSQVWEYDDRNGKPGYAGGYTTTAQVIGVQTRRQRMFFLDCGGDLTPVLFQTFPEPIPVPEEAAWCRNCRDALHRINAAPDNEHERLVWTHTDRARFAATGCEYAQPITEVEA